ncbi:MAG: hypothetical protein M0036_20895 [Desulfobacteraceae bacterium]|nr:hypothetical protein [Desulfobacteraceae bacterium]
MIANGVIVEGKLHAILNEAEAADIFPEALLIEMGVPKHAILRCLSDRYHLPFVEFSESFLLTETLASRLDLERLKQRLWFPLRVVDRQADVVVGFPEDAALDAEIKTALQVEKLNKCIALPPDITRIIEHNQDANPHYPASAGRTALARVRNALAKMRTLLAFHRTSLAKGRTGLAMMRTGLSFSAIALVLLQVFGIGFALIPDALLLVVGLALTVEGLRWYLPIRPVARQMPSYNPTESTFGSSFLEHGIVDGKMLYARHDPIEGADTLRIGWNRLSPIMKRRFLAIDRTDHAEERTALASYRSAMAKARTGLAFMRTGIALIGLGIALVRQFPTSGWVISYVTFILLGATMTLEGLHWYVPGRRAGNEGLKLIRKKHQRRSIWDFMFSAWRDPISAGELPTALFIKESHSPGIWGTTGLALERTLIAERRNVKARLRTILARSRTGMAFIRTGVKIFSVGMGLLVYFGLSNITWMTCYACLMVMGLIFIIDGFRWHLPAERIKESFPYCSWDMEIQFPDYAQPTLSWKKVVFSRYDL